MKKYFFKFYRWFKSRFVRCQHCKCFGAYYGRMNTQYVEDERNYITLCPVCWDECNEYYSELWSDYYSSVL